MDKSYCFKSWREQIIALHKSGGFLLSVVTVFGACIDFPPNPAYNLCIRLHEDIF